MSATAAPTVHVTHLADPAGPVPAGPPTDRELLAVPGGAYAVLARIRDAVDPHRAVRSAPPRDPWARPDWDTPTIYLPALAPDSITFW